MIRLAAAMLGCVLLFAACGGDDDGATSATATQSAGATSTATEAPSDGASPTEDFSLCDLLPPGDVDRITGHRSQHAQPHNGPGSLHFCTIYLGLPGCNLSCAVSLDDLGEISDANGSTPEAFRANLEAGNPDAEFAYTDGVLGPGSWLAVAQAGAVPGWKVVYFQAAGRAYDLSSPLLESAPLTEDQVLAMAQVVIDNLTS